jgi:SSS family solute:Na+ symporter
MTHAAVAISIILGLVAAGTVLGIRAGSGRKMNLEEWSVAGRSFGVIFIWLLMAGEIYTTFAFLGASGWAYSRGAPALYIMAYITLGYVVSFYMLPQIWELGRKHGLQTQSDFFRWRYRSKSLVLFVSFAGVLFLIPYLQLQLRGLGIIVQVASFGSISRTTSTMLAVGLISIFVFVGGMRAVAWVSVLKDGLMILAAGAIGIYVPLHYFGGIAPMFQRLAQSHASHLVMPGSIKTMNHSWFVSTVLLSALGFYMWPHTFGAAFTAKDGETLRRNASITPLYTLSLLFIFFAGFAAVLLLPGLADGDMSLLLLARNTFPAWFLGIIGGAGALTAMVPSAIILLTASTLMAKNVVRPVFAPQMSDQEVAKLSKGFVLLLSLTSLYLALHSSSTLVALLLIGYAGVTQFFPGVILGLFWPRATAIGVFAGLIVGSGMAAFLIFGKHDPLFGLNAGFLALITNAVVVVSISLVTPAKELESSEVLAGEV